MIFSWGIGVRLALSIKKVETLRLDLETLSQMMIEPLNYRFCCNGRGNNPRAGKVQKRGTPVTAACSHPWRAADWWLIGVPKGERASRGGRQEARCGDTATLLLLFERPFLDHQVFMMNVNTALLFGKFKFFKRIDLGTSSAIDYSSFYRLYKYLPIVGIFSMDVDTFSLCFLMRIKEDQKLMGAFNANAKITCLFLWNTKFWNWTALLFIY